MSRTLHSIAYVLVGVGLAKLLSVCTSIFVARTLQPDEYGVWVAILLISSYAGIAHMGTIEALLKQYPYLIGGGEAEEAAATERHVLGFLGIVALLVVLAALVVPLFGGEYVPQVRLMLATAGISLFSSFCYQRFAAHQEFKMVSVTDSTRAFYTSVFLIAFTWWWGLQGAVAGYFLAEVLVCVQSLILGRRVCGPVGMAFSPGCIWRLVKIGFPITLVWWVCILQQTTDRVISMSLLGHAATGYYGLGVSIVFTLVLIPQVIGQVLYPKINDGVGKRMDREGMEQLVITPTRALSLLLPLAIGLLIIISPYVYHELFPKYHRGLQSAQILLAGSFFICLFRNGANFLIASDRQNLLLCYVIGSLAFNVAATLLAVKVGLDIEGIALCSSVTSALLTTMIWRKTFAVLGHDRVGQARQLFQLYLPFLLLLLLMSAFRVVSPEFHVWTGIFPFSATMAFIAFMVALLLGVPPLSRWSRELCQQLRLNLVNRQ